MTKREKAHLITSVIADLREQGHMISVLEDVATSMLDQLFGQVPEWSAAPPKDRTGAAHCARRAIVGAGAWEALEDFGLTAAQILATQDTRARLAAVIHRGV